MLVFLDGRPLPRWFVHVFASECCMSLTWYTEQSFEHRARALSAMARRTQWQVPPSPHDPSVAAASAAGPSAPALRLDNEPEGMASSSGSGSRRDDEAESVTSSSWSEWSLSISDDSIRAGPTDDGEPVLVVVGRLPARLENWAASFLFNVLRAHMAHLEYNVTHRRECLRRAALRNRSERSASALHLPSPSVLHRSWDRARLVRQLYLEVSLDRAKAIRARHCLPSVEQSFRKLVSNATRRYHKFQEANMHIFHVQYDRDKRYGERLLLPGTENWNCMRRSDLGSEAGDSEVLGAQPALQRLVRVLMEDAFVAVMEPEMAAARRHLGPMLCVARSWTGPRRADDRELPPEAFASIVLLLLGCQPLTRLEEMSSMLNLKLYGSGAMEQMFALAALDEECTKLAADLHKEVTNRTDAVRSRGVLLCQHVDRLGWTLPQELSLSLRLSAR